MIETRAPARRDDVESILAYVRPQAAPAALPALALLAGLPATGKTHIAGELCARTGAVAIESDALRRRLFGRRTYARAESRRLFAAIHEAIDVLLAEGAAVVLDATNLRESERAPLYRIASGRGAALVIVEVTAPAPVARERLERRRQDGGSLSEADARVYDMMLGRMERIQRPHHVVDTSQDTGPVLAAIAKEMTGT